MNYSECLEYLYRLGNEVQTMKFGLETTRQLLSELGEPQGRFPSVLIAGTNGKGSVAHFLDSICRAAGIRTGLFTSPHLIRLQERIMVDGREIEARSFAERFTSVVEVANRRGRRPHPTFFELVTVTAFEAFAKAEIDLAILEIGMGGRLDSTNVVDPILSIITPISYDHQQYLGDSLTEIAIEKAGIMRPGRTTLSAPQCTEVQNALEFQARKVGAELQMLDLSTISRQPDSTGRYSFQFDGNRFHLSARGSFQVDNACLSLEAARLLADSLPPLGSPYLAKAVGATTPKAVLQQIGDDPLILLDGGHNRQAASALASHVRDYATGPRTLVLGMMKDKELSPVIDQLVPYFDRVHFTRINSPRAAALEDLLAVYPAGVLYEDPWEAYSSAVESSSTVVVAGSFYLVGLLLERLEDNDRFH